MLRQVPGDFRAEPSTPGFPFEINLQDGVTFGSGVANTSVWTPGATLIDSANVQGVGQHWSLLSVSFQAYMWTSFSFPMYGKLGRLLASVDPGGILHPTQGPAGEPFASPVLPLPRDSTLTTDLWGPEVDHLPPDVAAIENNVPGLVKATTINLPIPRQVYPGLAILVGLWLLPSLLARPTAGISGSGTMNIGNATYTLNFDDGS